MKQLASTDYEVLIIGGSAAGLSAALSLGRMQRRVLVCDTGQPRNRMAQHMHNFPGFDGVPPEQWAKRVRQELQAYASVEFRAQAVTSVRAAGEVFKALLSSGDSLSVRKVLLAYGIQDRLPEIDQIHSLWGKYVFHCPFCHGFEQRGRALALIGHGTHAQHILPALLSLSSDFIVFTQGGELPENERRALRERQVEIVDTDVVALTLQDSEHLDVVLKDGRRLQRQGLFVSPLLPLQPSSEIGAQLGCESDEMGLYQVNHFGQTSVPGVYAAGDIAGLGQSVLNAAAAGSMAGAALVFDLLGPLA